MRLSVLNPESERAPFADPRVRSDTAALSLSLSLSISRFSFCLFLLRSLLFPLFLIAHSRISRRTYVRTDDGWPGEGDATKNSAIFHPFSLPRGEIFTRSLVARRRVWKAWRRTRCARARSGLVFPRLFIFRQFPDQRATQRIPRSVHSTVNDFGEYIWWERKRFESIVHIRPCTIGIAQIHLGDWSYK